MGGDSGSGRGVGSGVGVVDLVVGVVVKVGGSCGAMVFWVAGMWLGWQEEGEREDDGKSHLGLASASTCRQFIQEL